MTTRKARKPLQEMTPQELQVWLAHRRAAVESFSDDVVAPYLQRRAARRRSAESGTRTDRQYEAWQREAAELAQGLEELRAIFEERSQGEQGAQP